MSGAIDPSRAQFDAFKLLPRDAPIQMLNLIRLREEAAYPDDHASHGLGLTGREAFRAYSRETQSLFARLDGTIVWSGSPEAIVIGPDDERWDLAFIAAYPNAKVFLAMISDPIYREAVKHRQAAVADSRLIRMAPAKPGHGFAS